MVISQIYQIINKANELAYGKGSLAPVDARNLVSTGDYVLNSGNNGSKDIWTKSIVDQCMEIIGMDRPLAVESLGLERDEREYGSYLVRYRVKPIAVEHNQEYDLGNESFDPFAVKTPDVTAQMYGDAATYEGGVTILNNQLKQAFQNESQMIAFFSYIMKTLSDAFVRSEQSWDRMALVNFIGEKLHLQAADDASATPAGKIHAVNILPEYHQISGKQTTAANVAFDPDFLKFYVAKMIEWKENLTKIETDIFNASTGYLSQVPVEYLKVFANTAITSKLPSYLYSDTYHKELVTLDGYKEVPFWQSVKDTSGNSLNFSARTGISVTLASDPNGQRIVQMDGILAVLMDKDAVATFYKREEAQSWMIPKKGTQYWKAETANYLNDLLCNAVVLYVADTNEESNDGE